MGEDGDLAVEGGKEIGDLGLLVSLFGFVTFKLWAFCVFCGPNFS
jgi:hypothetical protein